MNFKILLSLILCVLHHKQFRSQILRVTDHEFYEHLVNESKIRFGKLGSAMKTHLNPDPVVNISPAIEKITKKYATESYRLFEVMARHNLTYELEIQFYYLCIVQANNVIFETHSIKLLDDITEYLQENQREVNESVFTELIKEEVENEKIATMRYICDEFKVCRYYPGITDSIAKILEQVIYLSDEKLVKLATLFSEVIGDRKRFFKRIMNDDVAFKISSKLKRLIDQPTELRRLLLLIIEVLEKKWLYFKNLGQNILVQTKSLRLLMDIFDKAIAANGNEIMDNEFDNVMNIIKQFSNLSVGDKTLKRKLRKFVKYIVETLKLVWNKDTRKEVKILIELFMTATTKETGAMVDDLLHRGSKFLNDDI